MDVIDKVVGFVLWIASAVAALLMLVVLAALGSLIYTAVTTESATDPRDGVVYLEDGTSKYCDGPNLVYDGHRALDVIENAAECREAE